jgi:hypothetical protein
MSRRKGSGKHTKEKVGDDEWNKHTKEKELVKEHRRKDTHGQDESQLDAERKESNAKAEPEKKKHFASGLLKWFAGSPTVDKTNNAGFALFGGKDGGEEEENEKEQIRYMHKKSEVSLELYMCPHTDMYVSSYCYIVVPMLLFMCLLTTIYVDSC